MQPKPIAAKKPPSRKKKTDLVVEKVLAENPSVEYDQIHELAELCRQFEEIAPKAKQKWSNSGKYMAIWAKHKRGKPFFGNPGKEAMMELEEEHGLDGMLAAWEAFAKSKESRFGWKIFTSNLGDYLPKRGRSDLGDLGRQQREFTDG